jgi:polyhydroxybutyrate depolymerase
MKSSMWRFDRMLPRVAILAAIVLAAILSPSHPAAAGNAASHTIDANGVSRSCLLYVPPGQSGKHLPAIILMHGSSSTDAQQETYSNFDAFAQAHGLVVMYPQGIDRHWNDGRVIGHESTSDDIGFMKAMLAEVTAQELIDPKRVYVAEISNGGFMAQRMACVMPDALAGIAVVAATQPVNAACTSPRPMPAIFFHGTADKFVPFNGGPIAPQFGNRGTR